MSARVIAVVNQKGGVGKTTTVVNLGAALALESQRVLVIDLDPQSNLTLHLGLGNEELEKTCYDLLTDDDCRLQDVTRNTEVEGMDLVPATIRLADAEVELVSIVGRERVLSDSLADVLAGDTYDFILIDCAPSLGLLTLNALTTASEVFVVLEPVFLALQGTERLIRTMILVKKRLNLGLSVTGVILCMYNGSRKMSWEIADKIRGFFKKKVFDTFIRIDVKLAEAPSYGQPIQVYAPKSRGAEDYSNLAKEVLEGVRTSE